LAVAKIFLLAVLTISKLGLGPTQPFAEGVLQTVLLTTCLLACTELKNMELYFYYVCMV
jgi:hypothetical protein